MSTMATTKNRLYDRVQKANGDEDRDGDWLRFDGSDRIAAVSDEPLTMTIRLRTLTISLSTCGAEGLVGCCVYPAGYRRDCE